MKVCNTNVSCSRSHYRFTSTTGSGQWGSDGIKKVFQSTLVCPPWPSNIINKVNSSKSVWRRGSTLTTLSYILSMMKAITIFVTFFVTVLSAESEEPSSRLFQGKMKSIPPCWFWFDVSAQPEPVDLGLIYDFFTNDAGISRFQASSIAQVISLVHLFTYWRSLLVLLQRYWISHNNIVVDIISRRWSAQSSKHWTLSSWSHHEQSLQWSECCHRHCSGDGIREFTILPYKVVFLYFQFRPFLLQLSTFFFLNLETPKLPAARGNHHQLEDSMMKMLTGLPLLMTSQPFLMECSHLLEPSTSWLFSRSW